MTNELGKVRDTLVISLAHSSQVSGIHYKRLIQVQVNVKSLFGYPLLMGNFEPGFRRNVNPID